MKQPEKIGDDSVELTPEQKTMEIATRFDVVALSLAPLSKEEMMAMLQAVRDSDPTNGESSLSLLEFDFQVKFLEAVSKVRDIVQEADDLGINLLVMEWKQTPEELENG